MKENEELKTMRPFQRNALYAGVLFIIADLVGFLSLPFMAPVNSSDFLVRVSADSGLVSTAALLLFIGGVAAIGISVSLYPVLRRYNEGLALGSVGFRTVEGVLSIIAVACLLLLITLSHQYVDAGTPDPSYYQTFGTLTISGFHWVVNVCKLLAFSIGALLYYFVFYRTQIIPRWLSAWGIIAASMTITSAVLVMFGLVAPFSLGQVVLNLPIFFQEIVLAIWLILRGFDLSKTEDGVIGAKPSVIRDRWLADRDDDPRDRTKEMSDR